MRANLAQSLLASRFLHAFGVPSSTCPRLHVIFERNTPFIVNFSDKVSAATDVKTSVAWVEVHDCSLVSYGLDTANGYLELLPAKTLLPFKARDTLYNIFDFIRYATFTVCYRRSMLDTPTELGKLELKDIYIAIAGAMKAEVTIYIGRDLVGKFTARDRCINSEALIVFDG